MSPANISESFTFHHAMPQTSLDEHVRRRTVELGEWVMARDRIYLDKCFWIRLRKLRMGDPSPPGTSDLLAALTAGVNAGRLLCPISDALFMELMKQSDPSTREATAELIDELSCGVTLCSQQVRVATEVAHFLYMNSGRSVHPLEHLVWAKVAYILGSLHPVPTEFPEDEKLVIQKAFFDHLWNVSLSTMVKTIGDAWRPETFLEGLVKRLNHDNATHASAMKSFKQVYQDEIDGALELAAPIAVDVLRDMREKFVGRAAQYSTEEQENITRLCLGLLRAAVRKPIGRMALRTLHIGALLHAAVRWNRGQKLEANDIFDFHHAQAALGYCDAFLAERPMYSLLNQRHLAVSHDFKCHVMCSVEEAADWIRCRIS